MMELVKKFGERDGWRKGETSQTVTDRWRDGACYIYFILFCKSDSVAKMIFLLQKFCCRKGSKEHVAALLHIHINHVWRDFIAMI
mmetsp:Transcript_849/g.1777  ORF Transcript_849/g.1777 Transcript_849/m.1777 type:complete len:85 (+) Transcript_849:2796-3050(+)